MGNKNSWKSSHTHTLQEEKNSSTFYHINNKTTMMTTTPTPPTLYISQQPTPNDDDYDGPFQEVFQAYSLIILKTNRKHF